VFLDVGRSKSKILGGHVFPYFRQAPNYYTSRRFKLKSIILPHCWICQGKDGLNDHHVIPQAYGGVDGPQVTLCATHHTLIHAVALKVKAIRDHLIITHTSNKEQQGKLSQLIELIARARAATKSMEKPMMVQHKFNKERSRKLKDLKYLLGRKSIADTLDACIDTLHDQSTQLKTQRKI
jgi:hypothetical protein